MFLVNMHKLFLWKMQKGIIITNAFQKMFDVFGRKTNKIWVHKDSEF